MGRGRRAPRRRSDPPPDRQSRNHDAAHAARAGSFGEGTRQSHEFRHGRLGLDGGSAITGLVTAAEIRDGRYRIIKAGRALKLVEPHNIVIRDAHYSDMAAAHAIYAQHVLRGLASFEEIPPSLDEMHARRAAVSALGLPYVVAEKNGEVLGYAYANTYRARSAYRYTIEDSVYLAEGQGGRGIGTALLGELIARCEAASHVDICCDKKNIKGDTQWLIRLRYHKRKRRWSSRHWSLRGIIRRLLQSA